MAVEHVTAVLHGLFHVDPSAKLVMLIIAEHARRGSSLSWPSIETIARLACLQRRQVQAIITRLVELGWLVLERHGGGRSKDRGGLSNVYRINVERLDSARRNGAAERTVNDAAGNTLNGAVGNTVNGAVQRTVTQELSTDDDDLSTETGATVQPTAPLTVQSSAKKGAVEGGEGCSPASKKGAAGCLQTGFEPEVNSTGTTTGAMRAHAPEANDSIRSIGQIANRLKKKMEPERQNRTASGDLEAAEMQRRKDEAARRIAEQEAAKNHPQPS